MRNRPLWQILAAIVVFAIVQRYLQDPNSFFVLDSLIVMQQWLVRAAILSAVLFILEKSSGRGRACAEAIAVDKNSTNPVSGNNWVWLLAGFVFLVCIL